ncbi:hypothetical protein Hanom_Chr06g00579071 [Helianthus anomalus]
MLATTCLVAIKSLITRLSSCIESLDIPMFADHWDAPPLPISGCLTVAGDDDFFWKIRWVGPFFRRLRFLRSSAA